MSRKKLIIVTVYTVICLGVISYSGSVLVDLLDSPQTIRLPSRAVDSPARVEKEPEEVVELIPTRELEIKGWVFSGRAEPYGRRPEERGVIKLGDETADVSANGAFRFPEAPRPRLLPVVFASEGTVPIVFSSALTGDEDAVSGPQEEPTAASDVILDAPARVEYIAWTLVLLPEITSSSDAFRIGTDAVFVEDWGRGGRIRVQGRSNLPDQAGIYANLAFDGFRVAGSHEPGRVAKGSWSISLPLAGAEHLFAGRYRLEVGFNPRLEHADVLQSWRPDILLLLEQGKLESIGQREIFVGDPELARREDLEAQNYYRPLLARAKRLRRSLMTRLREIRVLGKGWDPSLLRANREAHDTWFQKTAVDDQGMLTDAGWRRFLDEEWRPEVEAILHEHRSRRLGKYREAEGRVEGLFDSLSTLSRLYSILQVYALFNLPPHPNDDYPYEEGAGDIALHTTRVNENLEKLERFCNLVKD